MITWLAAAALGARAPQADADADIETVAVTLDGQALFHVRGASSLPAEARAARISDRLAALADDHSVSLDSLKVSEREGLSVLAAGDTVIMAVTEADARLEQLKRGELAGAHLARMRQALVDYRQARTPEALSRGFRDVVGATVVFAVCIALVLLLRRWAGRLVERRVEAAARRVEARAGSSVQTLTFLRAERVLAVSRQLLRLLTALTLLVLLFQYVTFAFARFPSTRHLSRNLLALVTGPLTTMGNAVVREFPNLVFLLVLFVVFRIAVRLLRLVFDGIEHRSVQVSGFDADWAQPTYRIVRFAIIAFFIVVAYPYMPGSQSDAFKGVSLFVGLLLSLGSSSAVSNVIAGYSLIYRGAFKVGDRVKIGDVIGDVTESKVQVTRLRTPKNEEVIIPNSVILSDQVVNYSTMARTTGLIVHTTVGIGYETPWRQVEAMLLEAASRASLVLRAPAPFVLQLALGDFAVTYELNAYTAEANRLPLVRTELHRHVLDVFNEYGVQIMTPAYEGDPEQPKVVPPAQWYTAPAVPKPAGSPSGSAAGREHAV